MKDKIAQDLIPLVQRSLLGQLRELINELSERGKIEATQVILYQAGKHSKSSIKLLVPQNLDGKIHTVFAITEFLPAETLIEEAAEILENIQE